MGELDKDLETIERLRAFQDPLDPNRPHEIAGWLKASRAFDQRVIYGRRWDRAVRALVAIRETVHDGSIPDRLQRIRAIVKEVEHE
ncbi:MAG: hypothetical protein GWN58_17610 [Anaerolineae bacterium]|nr:hypothetical protein [Anaerolineae bacterium]